VKVCVVLTVQFGIARIIFMSLRARLEQTELELRDTELAEERATQLATTARLAALESQIQPHFFFNALNSITSLISEDPRRAERLMGRLAALFRFSLDSHSGSLVSLGKETKIVTDYLEIEQARLGERLSYDVQVPPELLDIPVPPFSIQTLVENSIKHAIAPLRAGGNVRIVIEAADDTLAIRVTDTGPGYRMDDIPQGHGLSNLQSRLSHIFGERAKLSAFRDSGTTTTQVTIPRCMAHARISG
jgi:LytS/YehU family sensor histidine kinase